MNEIRVEKRGRNLSPGAQVPLLDIKPGRIIIPSGVFGETGVGKSYQTIIEAQHYTKTIPGVKNGRKVLIFDSQGEYSMFPAIALKNIKDFTKIMVCRINAKGWSREDKKKGALYCSQNFKNGMLVVDDIDSYAKWNTDQDFTTNLMGGRHSGVDLVLCHQSLDMGTTDFYRNNPCIRLHNQSSNKKTLAGKAEQHMEILTIAELIVNKQYQISNDRFYLTINLRKKKIFGCSKRSPFTNACRTYLISNPGIVRDCIAELITHNHIPYSQKGTADAWDKGFLLALQKLSLYYSEEPYFRHQF